MTLSAVVADPTTGLVPTGMVEFVEGTTVLGTAPLDDRGKVSRKFTLASGAHAIQAVYLGSANFTARRSGSVSLHVV